MAWSEVTRQRSGLVLLGAASAAAPHLGVAALTATALTTALVVAAVRTAVRPGARGPELALDVGATLVVGLVLVGLVLGLLSLLTPAGWGAGLGLWLTVLALRRDLAAADLPSLRSGQLFFTSVGVLDTLVFAVVSFIIALSGEERTAFVPLSLALQRQQAGDVTLRVESGDEPGEYRLELVRADSVPQLVGPGQFLLARREGRTLQFSSGVELPAPLISLRLIRVSDELQVRELEVDPQRPVGN